MQTKNQIENMKNSPSICLDKALLFKARKLREGDGEQDITIFPS